MALLASVALRAVRKACKEHKGRPLDVEVGLSEHRNISNNEKESFSPCTAVGKDTRFCRLHLGLALPRNPIGVCYEEVDHERESPDKYPNDVRMPVHELRYGHILSWTNDGRPT